MAGYSVDPTPEQQSITDYLRAEFPDVAIIPDGLVDGQDDVIEYFPDQSVKPFIILWFSEPRRTRSHSFANYKLDAHEAGVDVVVIARSGTAAREFLNKVNDRLIGFKAADGGRLHKGSSLWSDSRQVIDDDNRPTRWARTSRFIFGIASRKIV